MTMFEISPEPIPGEPWEEKMVRLAKRYPPVPGYKKFQVGDRVQTDKYSTISHWTGKGENKRLVGRWDCGACNTGTVVAVTRFGLRGKHAPFIYVEPDDLGGFGFFMFEPHDLKNLTCPNWRARGKGNNAKKA